MQNKLVAGEAVTLVGATGEPLWHRWVHGPAAFAPAGGRDGACGFQALGPSLLDLCPDPMTDRYRLSAELCQIDVNGRTQNGELPTGGDYHIGLYFGRQSVVGNDGWRAENFFAVSLTEAPRLAPTGQARFDRVLVTESPTQRPTVSRTNLFRAPFVQAAALPGPWRPIEVEVTPQGVKAWLGQPGVAPVAIADLKADAAGRRYTARHDGLDKGAPNHGITFPAWNPRGAIGVWAFGSAVAVRNVTVSPLK
jgi:hypothetical protein